MNEVTFLAMLFGLRLFNFLVILLDLKDLSYMSLVASIQSLKFPYKVISGFL